MGWGLDFDFSEIIDSVWDASSDFVTDVVKDIEFSDIVSAAGVASTVYFQQQELNMQEQAIQAQLDAQLKADSIVDLADDKIVDTAAVTIDVGEVDITTEEQAELEAEESALNVGRIKADKKKAKSAAKNKLTAVKNTQLQSNGGLNNLKV